MLIREYRPSDKEVCLEIFKSNIPKFFLPEEVSAFEKYLDQYTQNSYWVIESEKGIVACGGFGVRGSEGRLHYGMVANSYHKKGLGSHLLKFRILKLIEIPHVKSISLAFGILLSHSAMAALHISRFALT